MPNEHAPLVLRDGELLGWRSNTLNMAAVPTQYGYGCLDGMVNTLKLCGDAAYLVAVDAGAHFARHIYNSARAVLYQSEAQAGTLAQAVAAGRSYDFGYTLSIPTKGEALDLRSYYHAYAMLMFENMARGFAHGNYVRPFYAACEERLDGEDSDFAINGDLYRKTFSIMMQHWPSILAPRHPDFPGLNLLVCNDSVCMAPGTSLTQFKSSSTYAPSRGPGVKEKNLFNERGKLVAHDILLYDYQRSAFREASGSNIFAVTPDGDVLTPELDGSIFPGLTRDFVLRLLQGKAGESMGLRLSKGEIDPPMLSRLVKEGGELFLTGSALGVIPARRVILPKNATPSGPEDYDVYEFRTGCGTVSAVIADCYRCFSVGDGFSVEGNGTKVEIREFEGAPLLFELDGGAKELAKAKLTKGLPAPSDQILISKKVEALKPKESRILTMDGYRKGI